MKLIPGFSSPSPPPPPPPPPPIPTRDTAGDELKEARLKQRQSEKRRSGRASTILTNETEEESLGAASITRPRAAKLLGG